MSGNFAGDGMGPCQVMAMIVGCTLVLAAIVAFLWAQGVPLFLAFLGVYAIAVGFMLGMLRCARTLLDDDEP